MPDLHDTIGHRIRTAIDTIAGRKTGKVYGHGRANNTFRLTAMNSIPGMSDEQNEWIMAIISFKRVHRRNPDLRDTLSIAKSLGYRKESS